MTRLYKIGKCWVDLYTAQEFLVDWVIKYGHFCNQVIDPTTCCPVAHGADLSECTCIETRRLQHKDFPSSLD